jgi:hypothetical protein
MRNLICIVLVVSVSLVSSCRKPDVVQPTKLYTEYFPFKLGAWVEYDVTSIIHTNLGSDTTHYILKEIYTEEFIDNSGNLALRIERLRKPTISDSYTIKDVWYANKSNLRAEKVEENIRFFKLMFPVVKGKKWNGNAFNNLDKWDYTYDSVHVFKQFNGLNFDSTVTVNQIDNVNPFQRQIAYEIYANHVGLIRKSYINISNNVGEELEMTVIAYGVE